MPICELDALIAHSEAELYKADIYCNERLANVRALLYSNIKASLGRCVTKSTTSCNINCSSSSRSSSSSSSSGGKRKYSAGWVDSTDCSVNTDNNNNNSNSSSSNSSNFVAPSLLVVGGSEIMDRSREEIVTKWILYSKSKKSKEQNKYP